MKRAFLQTGRVLTTHALSGEVKFEHWANSPDEIQKIPVFFLDESEKSPLKLNKSRLLGRFLLMTFDGVDTIDKAALLRGKILYARREDLSLSKDAVLLADLIGLPVRDAKTNAEYGVIHDVYNRGASDIWEIEKDGKITLFPAAKPFIDRIDPETAALINPPEGLFSTSP